VRRRDSLGSVTHCAEIYSAPWHIAQRYIALRDTLRRDILRSVTHCAEIYCAPWHIAQRFSPRHKLGTEFHFQAVYLMHSYVHLLFLLLYFRHHVFLGWKGWDFTLHHEWWCRDLLCAINDSAEFSLHNIGDRIVFTPCRDWQRGDLLPAMNHGPEIYSMQWQRFTPFHEWLHRDIYISAHSLS
jgi:hypothetical protein